MVAFDLPDLKKNNAFFLEKWGLSLKMENDPYLRYRWDFKAPKSTKYPILGPLNQNK